MRRQTETGRNGYKVKVKKRLKETFNGCVIMDLNPNDIQGIPDLLILYKDRWASLEAKAAEDAPHRPNQDHYVKKMNDMSYSSFIFPENEEVVFDQLKKRFDKS